MQDEEAVTATFRIYPVYNPSCVQEITVTIRHQYEEELTKRPTAEEGGLVTYTCTDCGHVYEKTLPPLTDLVSENVRVTLAEDTFTFDHKEKRPAVTVTLTDSETGAETVLLEDTDYIAVYSDNVNAGTAAVVVEGIGNFTGTRSVPYTVAPASIEKMTAALPQTVWTYDGSEICPDVTVKDADGNLLHDGEDFTLTYQENDRPGTGIITVTGIGNYTGTLTCRFTIEAPADNNISIGDVNHDGEINAVDASELLIAAAMIGAGEPSGLTAAQSTAADADANGEINAVDASIILRYAAAIGAGESAAMSDFI